MVEIFFGIITRQAIRRGTFTSVKDLIAAIETHRELERTLSALHLDQDRRRDPRKARPISTTNSWRGTLEMIRQDRSKL